MKNAQFARLLSVKNTKEFMEEGREEEVLTVGNYGASRERMGERRKAPFAEEEAEENEEGDIKYAPPKPHLPPQRTFTCGQETHQSHA